jgi:hypothetical protein
LAKGQTAEVAIAPRQLQLARRKISAGLSRKWSAIIHRPLYLYMDAVNVGISPKFTVFVLEERTKKHDKNH